jgi:hypothetical protein
MNVISLLGMAMGIGFTAGIRLYSTVLLIGLGMRYHLLHVPPEYAHLHVLGDTRVLVVAAIAWVLEFLADKVPWVDSVWDSVHTFVRPLGAGALVAIGLQGTDPALEVILVLLAGGIAFTGHSSKAATRLAVNHSPEPFSNIALSVVEEVAAPVASWVFLTHPYIAFFVVGAFLAVFAWLAPKIWRMLRVELAGMGAMLAAWLDLNASSPVPEPAAALARRQGFDPDGRVLRCAATRSTPGLKNSLGYLFLGDRRVLFVARRLFRWRSWDSPCDGFDVRRGLLLDRVAIRAGGREYRFDALKSGAAQ